MKVDPARIRSTYEALPSEALRGILAAGPEQYTAEARQIAADILAARPPREEGTPPHAAERASRHSRDLSAVWAAVAVVGHVSHVVVRAVETEARQPDVAQRIRTDLARSPSTYLLVVWVAFLMWRHLVRTADE